MAKANAETASMRIDCHINPGQKQAFLRELTDLAKAENLSVFYYFEFETPAFTNLMLFFTNGRQGLNLRALESVNVTSFGDGLLEILKKYEAGLQHLGGLDCYPIASGTEILMTDRDYILGSRI